MHSLYRFGRLDGRYAVAKHEWVQWLPETHTHTKLRPHTHVRTPIARKVMKACLPRWYWEADGRAVHSEMKRTKTMRMEVKKKNRCHDEDEEDGDGAERSAGLPRVACMRERGRGSHHGVHVGFGPDDVVVVVDDHGPTQHVQVLHHVLLHVGQRRHVRVVAWSRAHTHAGEA